MPYNTHTESATASMPQSGADAQECANKSRGRALYNNIQFFWASRIAGTPALSAYTATIVERCFIVAVLVWAALQGAFYYDAVLMSDSYWFVSFMTSSIAAFIFAARLSGNSPKASVMMQFAAITLMGLSLLQGGRMNMLRPELAWIMPVLALAPALYVALRHNLEIFALIGYMLALVVPVLAGLPLESPLFCFSYYLVLSLPLPIMTMLRGWKYLNICVFSWIFVAAAYYLGVLQQKGTTDYAQTVFVLSFGVYFLTVFAMIRHKKFNILNFLDFIFTVGLSMGGVMLQMRITHLQNGGIVSTAIVLAFAFIASGIIVRLIAWEYSATLGRIYLLFALLLLNGCFAMLWSGTTSLGVYCAEAILLFALGTSKDLPRVKAGGFIILTLTPFYFFLTTQHVLAGSAFIGVSFIWCAYLQDRELKRLALRSGRRPWSSPLELFLVFFGFSWCFGGLAVYVFRNMPAPGLIYFAISSASAYFFYAFGKLVRLRSLRMAIFIPMIISVPAVLLPFIYQMRIEWPALNHLVSYNYLTGLGALAWVSYFITVWTALYHNWGGLISNRTHAWLLALVTLELVLVLTSSGRAFALESGVSPSILSVLGVLPSLGCIFVLSRLIKFKPIGVPYNTPMYLVVPWVLFGALALWFVSALSSPGDAAPAGKYVPLLNPVEMVQLISIIMFGYWQRRVRKSVIPTSQLGRGAILWVYAAASFLWIHGVMFRVVQYFSQAQVQAVMSFVELRIIFACIWVVYGILAWIGSTMFTSSVSWLVSVLLLAAGAFTLVFLGGGLWGQFVAIVMSVAALIVLVLLIWRSPAPFTQRGKKIAERGY